MKKVGLWLVVLVWLCLSGCYGGETGDIHVDSSPGEESLQVLYMKVLDILFESDYGDAMLDIIAIDLSGLTNVTDTVKQAIFDELSAKTSVPCIQATFEELEEMGYIKDGLTFENGFLLTIRSDDKSANATSFHFSARKWKNVVRAVIYEDCLAIYDGSGWQYDVLSGGVA